MAEKNLIDQREYETVKKFVEEFRLAQHRPQLVARVRSINVDHPTSLDVRLWQTIAADVKQFRAFHEQYPFQVAPPGIIATGDIDTGLVQIADNQPLRVTRDEPFRHTGIFGMTGTAKTTLAQTYAEHLKTAGFHLHIIDGKRDSEHFVTRYNMLLLTPDMPIPLLDREYLGAEHARLLVRTLRRTMYGGEGLEQVATEALATTYERHNRPSLADLHRVLLGMERKGDTYTRRDRINGLALRIGRIIESYPGWSTTPAGTGLDLDVLRTHSWYFAFTTQTSTEDFLSTFLIEWLFARKRLLNDRTTSNVVFIDEAVPIFHDDTISGDAPLAPTLGLLREFRIGILLTANNVRALPAALKANLYLQVVMNLSDHAEASEVAKTFALTREEQEFLKHDLTRGTALCFLADRWRHTILAAFAPPTTDKVIDPADWDAAKKRTKTLAREVDTVAAKGAMDSHPATLSPSPAPTSAAPVLKTPQPPIALNTNETRLAEYLLIQRVQLATVAYNDLKLHPQAGTRAKNKLLTLGFITAEPVIARPGRGGMGVALRPTPSLHGRFNHRHIHGVRGPTSVQHEFLIHEIARSLALVVIEVTVGTKPVDIYVKNYHETHANVLSAVRDAAHHFTPATREPTSIESFGIEVETSDARKTAPNNAEKNFAAGIPLTIIAPMPSQFTAAVRALEKIPEHIQQHTIAIDVFVLLDLVREHRTREANV